jgi:hypothetical protein
MKDTSDLTSSLESSRRNIVGLRWQTVCLLCGFLLASFFFVFDLESAGETFTPNAGKSASRNKALKPITREVSGVETEREGTYTRKINFVYRPTFEPKAKTVHNQYTPSPRGWEEYDGSVYTPKRGYGWLTDLRQYGRDRGTRGLIVLSDGTKSSPFKLKRPELANFQGIHRENNLLVFRIDLPDGYYRVSCSSVDPDWTTGKPLVDRRSFKCRAHDVVFAGASYGHPLVAGGRQLIEGSGIVEVTEGHLRIVLGDPAYAGWVWTHRGPWYEGLKYWWQVGHHYANGWYQTVTRTVDPGFHSLTLNSLQIERVAPPQTQPKLVFRDFLNRDDSSDVNAGVVESKRWMEVEPLSRVSAQSRFELYKSSIRFTGPEHGLGMGIGGLLQQDLSPKSGIIRYSTRVSLFTGEGSQRLTGAQEAGILLLAEPSKPSEFRATFVGVQIDGSGAAPTGGLVYRVGNGKDGYRTNAQVPDTALPFKIQEGEYEIVVEHDVENYLVRQIRINGVDVTDHWSSKDRAQRLSRGLFGIRSAINNTDSRVTLQQYYWFYRVEDLGTSSPMNLSRTFLER